MTKPQTRSHMARITVTDAEWSDLREAARVRAISVTTYLGQLVAKEVAQLRASAARAETLTARHAHAALDDARRLGSDLEAIATRLEVLTRHPHLAESAVAEAADPATTPSARASNSEPRKNFETPPTPEELAGWQEQWKRRAAEEGPDWFLKRPTESADVPEWEP